MALNNGSASPTTLPKTATLITPQLFTSALPYLSSAPLPIAPSTFRSLRSVLSPSLARSSGRGSREIERGSSCKGRRLLLSRSRSQLRCLRTKLPAPWGGTGEQDLRAGDGAAFSKRRNSLLLKKAYDLSVLALIIIIFSNGQPPRALRVLHRPEVRGDRVEAQSSRMLMELVFRQCDKDTLRIAMVKYEETFGQVKASTSTAFQF
nr:uncharacterized protein LOC117844346 [Setaria viridis]